jgi:hypothetical protein
LKLRGRRVLFSRCSDEAMSLIDNQKTPLQSILDLSKAVASAPKTPDLCGELRSSLGNQDVAHCPPAPFHLSSRFEQSCRTPLDTQIPL